MKKIVSIGILLFFILCMGCVGQEQNEFSETKGENYYQLSNGGWYIQSEEVFFEGTKKHSISTSTLSDHWTDIEAVDSKTIYLSYFSNNSGEVIVERTNDSGKSWKTFPSGYYNDDEGKVFLSFIDKNRGYMICCSDPAAGMEMEVLFYSENGGERFEVIAELSSQLSGYVTDIGFIDKKHGVITVSYHGEDVYAYVTNDGGEKWNPLVLDIDNKFNYIDGISLNRVKDSDKIIMRLKGVSDNDEKYMDFISEENILKWRKLSS